MSKFQTFIETQCVGLCQGKSDAMMNMYREAKLSFTIFGGAIVVGTVIVNRRETEGRSSEFYHQLVDECVVPAMRQFLSPEAAHRLALNLSILAPTYRPSSNEQKLNVAVRLWDNKEFMNPVGLAAGYDKNATAIVPLMRMGFGFIEVGSVCLKAQPGNPKPRMFRLSEDEAIINRYGFNSNGADSVEDNLKDYRDYLNKRLEEGEDEVDNKTQKYWLFQKAYHTLWRSNTDNTSTVPTRGLLGINLGKNKTSATPVEDYQKLIKKLSPYADYLVINVSSPNTPGLRDLQNTTSLEELILCCQKARDLTKNKPPLLVKLSPDLTDSELEDIAGILMKVKIDGIVLTNTTIQRSTNLISTNKVETGGLSGQPLKDRSTECIRRLYLCTLGTIPIIGVGGIQNGRDAYEKLTAGASLVQVYSGMIYAGPGMISKIRDEIAQLMLKNGQQNLQKDVVGSDHRDLFLKNQIRQLIKDD